VDGLVCKPSARGEETKKAEAKSSTINRELSTGSRSMSKQREKYFIVAAGGYLPKPVVEEIVVDEEEMDAEFDDFDEYKTYMLQEAAAEFDQMFAKSIILSEAQAKEISVYLTK
jgi:6-phosphogluconolactonase/glucosamine-6-phosphate isomerase/deaminase